MLNVLMFLFVMHGVNMPGRLIVRVRKGRSAEAISYLEENYKIQDLRALFRKADSKHKDLFSKYRLNDYYVVDFSLKTQEYMEFVKKRLLSSGLFESVEPDFMEEPMYNPSDPKIVLQWAFPVILADKAWDVTKGSKNIRIVIDDTGVDWKHEDLLGNLWQNLGEDADGDGHVIELVNGEWQFDPGDINGVDDDGDGYVDDFIGWNFRNSNNNPEPDTTQDGYYHGTHVAGICSAVSDNGVGVASVAFSASIVASRSYWVSNSADALQWAGDMGFDVFNMSWGLYNNLSYLESAINYAHDAGVLLVAAAGNEETSDSLYPAAYANVMAVAATNRNDQHAYYTNYGDYIDIAAPGGDYQVDPMILSTMPDSSYDYLQGTSMASPMLASVAGLVKAANPFLSNDNIKDILINTADSINDTYYNQGLLGAGRVNAYKAVIAAAKMLRAFVVMDSLNVTPPRPLVGDTVHFVITILDSSGWQAATGLTVTLSCSNPDVIMLDTTYDVGDLSAGNRATVDFRGVIPSDFVPSIAMFTVSYTTTGYMVDRVDTFSVKLGHPYVIIIDDANNSGNYINYYTTSLDSLGFVYDVHDISANGLPVVSGTWGLSSYDAVIWFTGDETTPLSQDEIDTLEAAIDAGTNVFISSQNLAESDSGTAFLNDYLGAEFDQSGASDIFLKGVTGDPIGDGISLVVAGAGGAQNATSKDIIHAVGSGVDFIGYGTDGSNGGAGVRNEKGSAKVVFIAFPFEAINGQVSGQNSKIDFMGRILSWMGLSSIKENVSSTITLKRNTFIVSGRDKVLNLGNYYKNIRGYNIYTLSGRRVMFGNNGIVNVGNLKNGLYIIEMSGLKKRIKLLKVK